MQNLQESLSIETWKIIAHQIQRISLPSKYYFDGYRVRNELEKLKRKLLSYNIDIIDGYSENDGNIENKEAGLLTLLEDICKITTSLNYEQAAFFERIHKLDQIGIKTISYNPFYFKQSAYNLKGKSHIEGVSGIYIVKNYTDGKFLLSTEKDLNSEKQTLSNIQDANFILEYGLICDEEQTVVRNAHATIKSFKNCNPPCRSEIEKHSFAKCIESPAIDYQESTKLYQQDFKILTADDIRDVIGYPKIREKIKYYYKNVK